MIRLHFLIFVFSLICVHTHGQIKMNKDSLLTNFKNDPDNLKNLSDLSQYYGFSNPDSAIYYGRILADKAINDPDYTGRAYQSIANAYLVKNDLGKAEENYKNAISVSEKAGLEKQVAVYEQALAQAYLNSGQLKEALLYYNKALPFFTDNPETEQRDLFLSVIYGGIGNCYNFLGNYDIAVENQFTSLKYAEKINDPISIAINYNSIASIYNNMENYENSIIYNQKALEKFQTTSYPLGEATVYLNLASSHFKNNQVSESLELLAIAEKTLLDIPTTYNLGEVYSLYGEISREENKHDESAAYFEKAISIHSESGSEISQASALFNLAKTNYARNNPIYKSQYEEALRLFRKNNLPKEQKEALEFWISVNLDNNLNGDFKEYLLANDSFLDTEKQNAFIAQEVLYETSKKEAKIAQQDLLIQKEKNNRNLAISSSALILLIAGGGLFWNRNRQRRIKLQHDNTLLELQQNLTQIELSQLNQQLDPHEIKNILTSISPEIQENAPDAYLKMIKLLNVTKSSLNKSLTENLATQIQQIEDYLTVYQTIMHEPFSYTIENNLEDASIHIPRLLLKNFVENAVKHGIKGNENGGKITVSLMGENGYTHIYIDDTGKGRQLPLATNSGIGIETYAKLFDTLNKKNKKPATIEIIDKEKGTKVEVRIPEDYKYQ